MSFCSKCGIEIRDESAVYCQKCGANLKSERTPDLETCPRCGKKSLFWNNQTWLYQCQNVDCHARVTKSELETQHLSSENQIIVEKEINIKQVNTKSRRYLITTVILSIIILAFIALFSVTYFKLNNQLDLKTLEAQNYSEQLNTTKVALQDTNNKLTNSQSQLTAAQNQVKTLQGQLASTQAQLTSTQDQLTSTQGELTSSQSQLKLSQDQLSSIQTQLTFAQTQLQTTQGSLTVAQNQLKLTQTELNLYKDTWGSVVASGTIPPFQDASIINQPTATNPTWAKLQTFILSDKTDQHTYIPGIYTCGEYARDVYNNAERAGIRAAYVAIKFSDAWHACNAFKTTDRGLVFIDCGGLQAGEAGPSNCDKTVNVKKGTDYKPTLLFSSGWTVADMGKVLDVQIYW